jgi:hypothetical protein
VIYQNSGFFVSFSNSTIKDIFLELKVSSRQAPHTVAVISLPFTDKDLFVFDHEDGNSYSGML